jgi:hypothetical protein
LLVIRRELLTNTVPAVVGGGTIVYVNQSQHEYLNDPEQREEGGTPDIIGTIRAGLAFQLKDAIGAEVIREREHRLVRRVIDSWSGNPNVDILGNCEVDRVGVVSFNLKHRDKVLHHNYVVALLNDLFGIQSRGGCSCAAPYGHDLLGIDPNSSQSYCQLSTGGFLGVKPGWVRLSFPYFMTDPTIDYVIDAVHLIAEHGHNLVSQYRFDAHSGQWTHERQVALPWSLSDVVYSSANFSQRSPAQQAGAAGTLDGYMEMARQIVMAGPATGSPATSRPEWPREFDAIRWFTAPDED